MVSLFSLKNGDAVVCTKQANKENYVHVDEKNMTQHAIKPPTLAWFYKSLLSANRRHIYKAQWCKHRYKENLSNAGPGSSLWDFSSRPLQTLYVAVEAKHNSPNCQKSLALNLQSWELLMTVTATIISSNTVKSNSNVSAIRWNKIWKAVPSSVGNNHKQIYKRSWLILFLKWE